MSVTRIPVQPGVRELVQRRHVLRVDRFRELGSSSSVLDDELMNHEGPSDDELHAIELNEARS